jgi:galactokinase
MAANGQEHELFVSGRLCLFGEHADWAAEFGRHKGYCLVIGTDQGIAGVARENDSLRIETGVPDSFAAASGRRRHMECPWQADALLAAAQDHEEFFRYCAGVAHVMLSRPGVRGGLDLRITAMDLPLKKGVSSSAAVCILVAQAFNTVYDLGMFPHELMEAAYLGERLTGSQCGRMDQACIYGKTPVLLTFQKASEPRVEPVFPGGAVDMFIVDLGGQKDTVRILADLRAAYLVDRHVQRGLGPHNERIVRQAYMALGSGDVEWLGRLMVEAQETFDRLVAPACPQELASPLLHRLLAFDGITRHVHGGKGVGSQGDGTAQFVARSPADRQEAMAKIADAFPQMRCFPLTIAPSTTPRRAVAGNGGK